MSLSIGVYEILGSCDVWHFLHHQHHRPPQSSHCNDESLVSGIVIDFNFSSVSRTNILWKSPYCFSFIIDFQTSQLISVSSEKADTEWKFARSKLWISYFKVSHISRFFIVAFWSQFKVFHGHTILLLSVTLWAHHYIKGNISVFSRGFVCFCYFNPNFLHGDLHLYCGEYWGDSRMSALKKWGVKTQLLFFCPFWWLENQLCCHKSCIQTAVECLSSFESPLNQASMGCFYETMSNWHSAPKMAKTPSLKVKISLLKVGFPPT